MCSTSTRRSPFRTAAIGRISERFPQNRPPQFNIFRDYYTKRSSVPVGGEYSFDERLNHLRRPFPSQNPATKRCKFRGDSSGIWQARPQETADMESCRRNPPTLPHEAPAPFPLDPVAIKFISLSCRSKQGVIMQSLEHGHYSVRKQEPPLCVKDALSSASCPRSRASVPRSRCSHLKGPALGIRPLAFVQLLRRFLPREIRYPFGDTLTMRVPTREGWRRRAVRRLRQEQSTCGNKTPTESARLNQASDTTTRHVSLNTCTPVQEPLPLCSCGSFCQVERVSGISTERNPGLPDEDLFSSSERIQQQGWVRVMRCALAKLPLRWRQSASHGANQLEITFAYEDRSGPMI